MGHLLMENRSGLVIGAPLTVATGHAERDAATALIAAVPGRHRITVGADRAYDAASFVAGLRALNANAFLQRPARTVGPEPHDGSFGSWLCENGKGETALRKLISHISNQ